MEDDARDVREALQAALNDTNLTQAEFAAALGTSASRFSTYRSGKTMPTAAFYVRTLCLAAALKAADAHGWMTPTSTARAVRRATDAGDDRRALTMVLQGRDHLRELLRTDDAAAEAWYGASRGTGSRRWDALIATLTAHEFESAGRAAPSWSTDAKSHLDERTEWVLPSLLFDDTAVRAATPTWLARRRIYATERDLATA